MDISEEDLSNLSDEELLKKIQPGITSDVDKYFIELAHRIVDGAYFRLGEPAIAPIEDLETDYETAKSEYEARPVLENEVAMLKAQIKLRNAQIEAMKGRQAKMEQQKPFGKSSFVKGDVGGGLKTRRSKHRNGPSRVRRHRSRRVSSRKVKA